MDKILLGLSGGVDSAYAAYALMNSGYKVVGLHMRFYQHPRSDRERERAMLISEKLGFECHTLDCTLDFEKKVINRFVAGYLSGITPNPCLYCNYHFKYSKMVAFADQNHIEKIALGHYAEIIYEHSLGHYVIKKSKNVTKDQSYLLFGIHQQDLHRYILPMQTVHDKRFVNDLVKSMIPELKQAKESQDICFVGNKNYPGFIIRKTGIKAKPGYFIDREGNKIGKHKGVIYYTTGQKKGLSQDIPKGMCIVKMNASTNEIVVGSEEDLIYHHIEIEHPNILVSAYLEGYCLTVKTSQWGLEKMCLVRHVTHQRMGIEIPDGMRAPEIGQGAVIYRGEIVVAGGIIQKIR